MADEEEDFADRPVCSYLTYKSVGDRLYRLGKYEKAIQSYTLALQREPKNKNCLVARSRCFLSMGNTTAALSDAEASQMEKNEFPPGLYQKAESLYVKGEFELALMYYHRGQKLRPHDHLFRLGIQKAQEAITNSVGSPSSVRLDTKGDLSFFYSKEEKLDLKQQPQLKAKTSRTARKLLGELYPDKEFLENLLMDKELMKMKTELGGTVQDLVAGGLSILDAQAEFWQEQKPIFARERERQLKEQIWKSHRLPTRETAAVLEKMVEIDALFADGHVEECRQTATELLERLKGWTTREVPSKVEFVAHLYNIIGNAQAELGDVEGALESLKKDLRISRKYDNTEGISRALDNLGRVYARIGEFEKATEVWLEKEPLAKSSLERTWLFHEIGRCYLELKNHEGARDYGLKSLASAEKAGDEEWKMNAHVLVAQAEFKLGNLHKAMTFFEQALDKAILLNDDAAQVAISNALQNVQEEIDIAEKAKEEELEQHRKKHRASRMDVSPLLVERIRTKKPKSELKRKINFDYDGPIPVEDSDEQGSASDIPCSEDSSSTDSVCGIYSSESLPVSDGSNGEPTVADVIKTEEDLECEDSLTSTSSDSVCLLPSLSTELHQETKGQTSDLADSAPEGVAAEAGAEKGGAVEGGALEGGKEDQEDVMGQGEAAREEVDKGEDEEGTKEE